MDHRRVNSEIFLRFPEEISFGGSMEGEDDDVDDLLTTYMDMENIEYFGENQNDEPLNYDHNNHNHNKKLRHCFSVDEFSGLSNGIIENDDIKTNNKDLGVASCEAKKAMPPDKLAELWVVDPKRAKRILANRQSAARSKERKARYMQELEKKVKSLQTEATSLSVQLSLFKRDTTGLTTENIELRRQLDSMEQQAQLRDALNEALKQELDRLKAATGDTSTPSDTLMQNVPLHSQQQQHHHQQQQQQQHHHQQQQQHQQQQCTFESNLLITPQSMDQCQQNMLNIAQAPKITQTFQPEPRHFVPLDIPKPNNMPQFCATNEANNNMNYHPLQTLDSPLGHLPPPYPLESNTQSPDQDVYVTSQPPHLLKQLPKQDHVDKLQCIDSNGLDFNHLVKVDEPVSYCQ